MSTVPVVEQVIVVYEPRVAATTCPFPDEAETTGGTTCCGGAGHLGVGSSATGGSLGAAGDPGAGLR